MNLELKISTINAVRDDVFGHPLSYIIAALGSDFCHFGHLSKVHLNPLSDVVGFSDVRALVIQPAIARSIASTILQIENKICLKNG